MSSIYSNPLNNLKCVGHLDDGSLQKYADLDEGEIYERAT